MKNKKMKSLSMVALIVSALPAAALIPAFLKLPCRMGCVPYGLAQILFLSCWGCFCRWSVYETKKAAVP